MSNNKGRLAAIFAQHIIGQGITSNPQDFLGLATASRGCRQLLMRVADNLHILSRHDLGNRLFYEIFYRKKEFTLVRPYKVTNQVIDSNFINLRKKLAWDSFCYRAWRVLYPDSAPKPKRTPEEEALVQCNAILAQIDKSRAQYNEFERQSIKVSAKYREYVMKFNEVHLRYKTCATHLHQKLAHKAEVQLNDYGSRLFSLKILSFKARDYERFGRDYGYNYGIAQPNRIRRRIDKAKLQLDKAELQLNKVRVQHLDEKEAQRRVKLNEDRIQRLLKINEAIAIAQLNEKNRYRDIEQLSKNSEQYLTRLDRDLEGLDRDMERLDRDLAQRDRDMEGADEKLAQLDKELVQFDKNQVQSNIKFYIKVNWLKDLWKMLTNKQKICCIGTMISILVCVSFFLLPPNIVLFFLLCMVMSIVINTAFICIGTMIIILALTIFIKQKQFN